MIHSCIGLEFRNDRELYVLTAHQDGEDFESRILMFDIETGELELLFMFENWIKRFKIIDKEAVWASQWDDSFYRLTMDSEDQYDLPVGCITDFKLLADGTVIVVGLDGKMARVGPDGTTMSLHSPTKSDLLYCLPHAGLISVCGARGAYFEMGLDLRPPDHRPIDLQTGTSATLLVRGSDQSDWSRFAGGGSTANRSRRPSRRRSRRLIRSQASRSAFVTSGSRKFS